MTKNIIIAALVTVILLLLYAMDPGKIFTKWWLNEDPAPSVKVHEDSVIVARMQMDAIFEREKKLIEKWTADSMARVREKIAHKKEVAYYKRRLSEINFDGTTSLELDSIRNDLYPPGDSSFIVAGPDPLYSMPISQARDALESKARVPFRDSVDAANEARIDTLETQVEDMGDDCADRLAVKDEAHSEAEVIIRNLQAANDKLKKQEKRRKKWGWVKNVGSFLLGGLAGRGSKP